MRYISQDSTLTKVCHRLQVVYTLKSTGLRHRAKERLNSSISLSIIKLEGEKTHRKKVKIQFPNIVSSCVEPGKRIVY